MGFTENQKQKVKEKAAFRCCRCQTVGVHIHHIRPKIEGGSDDIDNAAPLCPSCHDYYGNNPSKRKEIKQMREWWYKTVKKMYPDRSKDFELLRSMDSKLEIITKSISDHDQKWEFEFNDLKQDLKELSGNLIESINTETAYYITPGIIETFSSIRIGDRKDSYLIFERSEITCSNCNEIFEGYKDSFNICPNCSNFFPKPEIIEFGKYKQQLSDISNDVIDTLNLGNAPTFATGIMDTFSNLERPTFYITKPTDYVKCPKCSYEFFGCKNSFSFCPNCHSFSFFHDDI